MKGAVQGLANARQHTGKKGAGITVLFSEAGTDAHDATANFDDPGHGQAHQEEQKYQCRHEPG